MKRMDTEFPLLRAAHETPSESLRDRNDEVLERIYIGTPLESLRERRFKNDTVGASEAMPNRAIAFPEGKRLEKLFDLYTKMTS